jgi:hypothetical protein
MDRGLVEQHAVELSPWTQRARMLVKMRRGDIRTAGLLVGWVNLPDLTRSSLMNSSWSAHIETAAGDRSALHGGRRHRRSIGCGAAYT